MPVRPNIIIIYADDLGWGDLGCYGADELSTPAIDTLAENGVRFTDWYSNSPVCSPSRASLLTGRYPAHCGVESILGGTRRTPGLKPQRTLADSLRGQGYTTGIFGKWHLGADPTYGPLKYGFDTHFGFRAGCVDYYSHIFYWNDHNPIHDLWEDDEEVWRNGEYLTTIVAERAAGFIEDHSDGPFLCYVPFNAPHYPLHAPEHYVSQFSHLPEDRRMMAAMIKAMDDGVGHIMGTLERLGLREDTLVFFSSDNGPSTEERNWLNGEEVSYMGGSAGGLRGHKGSVFEGGIRVPAIISWPRNIGPGQEITTAGVMMDVAPTVLDAVGCPPESDIDGRSMLGTLLGADAPERTIFWEYEQQSACRSGRWKLVLGAIESLQGPVVVEAALFDLMTDPSEQNDVQADYPDMFERLSSQLRAWSAENASLRNEHE
ncbi:sulfatase-like hydrolase/transferase [Arthrobacter castelli]|uniref:sulfatase-like hydrolase/transferase n=1 Tax=Arthrobacter castelli TaxID=271431 RepID=UPI0003FA4B01|nr:sulfatase-like hydrolase/transferase [Arthrobacter castelli]